MCLMNAYLKTRSNENLLMKSVQRVETKQDKLVLFDLLERKMEVEGHIKQVDMMENFLVIEGNEA